MNQSKLQSLLFSAAGVLLVFIAIVGANLLFNPVRVRLDMTADKLHTLSDGTRKILAKLDTPIEIRLYATKSENRMPSALKTHVQNVEDLLAEFKAQAKGNIEIKKFDPEPDSEAEDLAKLDGIEPQMLQTGDSLYLGLAVSLDPNKTAIPFLSPQREKLLEYDIARAISQVVATNKPVIGVMSPLQVFGMQVPPQMMMRMGQQGQDPWIFINELKRDFKVEQVNMDVDKIDDQIKVLVVVHPKDITDKAQFAIDQFVLRGGKLIAFLDPLCLVDNRQPNPMGFNMGGGSGLPKLLKAWGLEFESSKVIADPTFATRPLQGRDGRPQIVPSFLFLNPEAINRDDAVTSQSDDIWFPFPGAFTGKPADGLKEDILIKTTTKAQLVDGVTAQLNGQKVMDELKPAGVNYALAVRLTGKFKTAFPDGKPAAEKKDDAKDGEKKDEPKDTTAALKESKTATDSLVYLFGDVDFLADQFSVEINPMFRMAIPRNGNLALIQNLVEQASGDANLVGARSRASLRRPFTVVQKIETEARLRYQSQLEDLEKRQQETQSKLNEVQIKKEGNTAKVILTPEQKQAIENYQKQQVETRKALKELRKNLRQDVESLENRLKWSNIALMPALVTATGIGLYMARRSRQGAR